MAAAEEGRLPYAVCEIYTTVSLSCFYIQPAIDGIEMLGGRRPVNVIIPGNGGVRRAIEIEANLIVEGTKKWNIDEVPISKGNKKVSEEDNRFAKLSNEHNYATPALAHGEYYKYVVFNNHPYIGSIVETYKRGLEESKTYRPEAIKFITELNTWVSSTRSKMPTIDSARLQSAPDVRSNRPPSVLNKVKKLKTIKCNGDKECEAAAEAGGGGAEAEGAEAEGAGGGGDIRLPGGSRRHRRPSRKYKKSKRVLRRKSRSTRRR